MIFVTVGTHEHPFNRLVEYMDSWAQAHNEEVVMQTGYSTYVPQRAKWSAFLPYNEMNTRVEQARIVITHGGPSSFVMPLRIGKIPVVVPRQARFHEHVNDHQLKFSLEVERRMNSIITVSEINDLGAVIEQYEAIERNVHFTENNVKFNAVLEEIVEELFEKK